MSLIPWLVARVSLYARPQSIPHSPVTTSQIPAMLKKAGYATYHIGKWHQGYFQPRFTPHGRGFDKAYGMTSTRVWMVCNRVPEQHLYNI